MKRILPFNENGGDVWPLKIGIYSGCDSQVNSCNISAGEWWYSPVAVSISSKWKWKLGQVEPSLSISRLECLCASAPVFRRLFFLWSSSVGLIYPGPQSSSSVLSLSLWDKLSLCRTLFPLTGPGGSGLALFEAGSEWGFHFNIRFPSHKLFTDIIRKRGHKSF